MSSCSGTESTCDLELCFARVDHGDQPEAQYAHRLFLMVASPEVLAPLLEADVNAACLQVQADGALGLILRWRLVIGW